MYIFCLDQGKSYGLYCEAMMATCRSIMAFVAELKPDSREGRRVVEIGELESKLEVSIVCTVLHCRLS